jgi:hypothetical protein
VTLFAQCSLPDVFRREDWIVCETSLSQCQELVANYHYAGGGSNTATFRHGLFYRPNPVQCLGIAWWIPPTKSAALATYPEWKKVLSLSRLVVDPRVPRNGASFLIAASIKLIRKDPRWECLLTYADTWQGHTGGIYRATNWEYTGITKPQATWIDSKNGNMVAKKAGPRTRTKSEMEARS